MFDPFVQQRQALDRSRGGLGLGLTIVRSLVEKHGGTVRAESDGPGRGSEFIVRVPGADLTERDTFPTRPERYKAAPLSARVLIVDDNEDAADMLEFVLSHLGFVVATAHDGPSALTLAAHFAPDVALLDIGLPVMDGYELAGRLRAECGPTLVLIAITGYGQPADRARSVVAGFDHHLVKPIDLERLKEILRSHTPERTTH